MSRNFENLPALQNGFCAILEPFLVAGWLTDPFCLLPKVMKTILKMLSRVPLDKSEGSVKHKLSLAMRKHRNVCQRS